MSDKTVEIVITQPSIYFEEFEVVEAIQEDDGFTAIASDGNHIFIPDGEAELTGEEHE